MYRAPVKIAYKVNNLNFRQMATSLYRFVLITDSTPD